MRTLNYTKLPEALRAGMRAYVEDGEYPPHFLKAVICNQLYQAFSRADLTNKQRMTDIVDFLITELPMQAWGSENNMLKWIRMKKQEHDK